MAANQDIINAVTTQIDELQPGAKRQAKIDAVLKELKNLDAYIGGKSNEADQILNDVIQVTSDIQSGKKTNLDFGNILGDLDTLTHIIESKETDENKQILFSIITQIEGLLSYRPDVESVMGDLQALRNLKGGPADATSFHDFHCLQIAFKSVWQHAFDGKLKGLIEKVYLEHTKLYDGAGPALPPLDAINDINQIADFKRNVEASVDQLKDEAVPAEVIQAFPTASAVWNLLSGGQRFAVYLIALFVLNKANPQDQIDKYIKTAQDIFNSPDGPAGRLSKLLYELGKALNEPYAFDVFAKYSYNFGLMLTYRQKWEPGAYQAGDLVSTIPLAPGESRKYSKKINIKKTRSEKEIEKSMSSSSYQSSETSRAEADIMNKTSSATNFKMSASGSFNIGIGSIDSSTEFSTNQALESITNKKEFHEATLKAAQEYKLERSMEVDTSSAVETEETNSGEISNPNNEITVTYLFYELQRRYLITEFLYRARPVILVALDVPAPHEIDEAWLIQYQWIISRVLLDDSLRSALNYLISGFAGDEVSIEIIKAHWEEQRNTLLKLEGTVTSQLTLRDNLRDFLAQSQLQEKINDAKTPFDVANFLFNPYQDKAAALGDLATKAEKKDVMEANRDAAETRLKYVEQALADAQEKYRQSSGAFQEATKQYAAAMQNQFSRHVAIDQLRVHVKQNILYYMQAIWSHKVSDQLFFELYKLPIDCPEPEDAEMNFEVVDENENEVIADGLFHNRIFSSRISASTLEARLPKPSSTWDQHELVEMADLDNPLGFKGNYIIFPLKEHCYLTQWMLTQFIDEFTNGIKDPDSIRHFLESFDDLWEGTYKNPDGTKNALGTATVKFEKEDYDQAALKKKLEEYVSTARRITDEIIVPTGQLFIEALPGSHPLLEDFKLLHRIEDVRKVKAEVRHAELENLRLAARLFANQDDPAKDNLLEDPDIEKKIIVEGNAGVNVGDN